MPFFYALIRQCCTALVLSLLCHTAFAQSALRLEMRDDNIARFYDGSTIIWSGVLPHQMPIRCLETALEHPGETIACPPHVSRRLGLRFDMPALMPVQEQWEWQSYSARITRDGPDITLRGAIRGTETHITLSILFWIFVLIVLTVLWRTGFLGRSTQRPPDQHT